MRENAAAVRGGSESRHLHVNQLPWWLGDCRYEHLRHYGAHSGKKFEDVDRDIDRDKILTATEAIEYGLSRCSPSQQLNYIVSLSWHLILVFRGVSRNRRVLP